MTITVWFMVYDASVEVWFIDNFWGGGGPFCITEPLKIPCLIGCY